MFKNAKSKLLCAITLATAAIISFISGYLVALSIRNSQTDAASSISLSVSVDESVGLSILGSSPTGSSSSNVTIYGLSDVYVSINNKSNKLDQALQNNQISIENLIAQAQIDAAQGKCEEICSSEYGLTTFIYKYPEFDLVVCNDMFECKNGDQYMIRDLGIAAPGKGRRIEFSYMILTEDGELINLLEER